MTRTLGTVVAAWAIALTVATTTAEAVRPQGAELSPQTWDVPGEQKPLRAQPVLTTSLPLVATARWGAFVRDVGPAWTAVWDGATGVPNRLFGQGISAPGTVASADAAASHARNALAQHIGLLAPGAELSDFVLVTNRLDRDTRSIGFLQFKDGIRVLGGQVSFRYKNDRLFMIGSEAYPHVTVSDSTASFRAIGPAAAAGLAESWMFDKSDAPTVAAADGPFILPIVGEEGVRRYATVYRVEVNSAKPVGSWDVYIDSVTGAAVARRQMLAFADGTVLYNVPLRRPNSDRVNLPARDAQALINGVNAVTNEDGVISFASEAPVQVTTTTDSPLVKLSNRSGANATGNFTLSAGGQVVWNLSGDEALDAQLSAFIHARIAKDFARELNPTLPWLDETIPVNVNIEDTCNAFSDGHSINFFVSSLQCANTARLADVVYHEFGHSLHSNSVIEGVGRFDGAHSEGLSDFLASAITGDPAMGRGFFHSAGPLRHIDPPDREHIWPDDIAGIHTTGLIFSGAMWDLRKLLIEKLGTTDGIALTNRLFYATLQRATNIPSTYFEVLAEDDDDGDLSNGTPNICDINTAFGLHGLRAIAADVPQLANESLAATGHDVTIELSGLFPQCPGDTVVSASVHWELRDTPETGGDVAMDPTNVVPNQFLGTLPQVEDGTAVRYQIEVQFTDGTRKRFPDNPADPYYEFFVGDVVTLYCTDFEEDPFANGWSHGLANGEPGDGADDWQWGEPLSVPNSGDPPAAFDGSFVIGNDLGGGEFNGRYQPDKVNFAESPTIVVGRYSDVHLQYFRWLNVEDAFFDKASIYVNDELAWQNLNSQSGNDSAIHHTDSEWRFHDVPLSHYSTDEAIRVKFELASDGGLEFGGWNIDRLCVVAVANSICGDGNITGPETCDNAGQNNDNLADACRTNCRVASCGDSVIDSGEECDDGNNLNGDDCTPDCRIPSSGGCGCAAGEDAGNQALGTLLLFALIALVWTRRRRR